MRTNQKVENGKTTNGTKVEGLSHKIQTRKFVAYLHFFMDLLPALGKLSLVFQMDNLFLCSIPVYLRECLSYIEELNMVPEENFQKLCTKVNIKAVV